MARMSFTIAVYVIRGLPLLNLMYHLQLSLLFPSAHKDFGHFYGELLSQVYLKGTLWLSLYMLCKGSSYVAGPDGSRTLVSDWYYFFNCVKCAYFNLWCTEYNECWFYHHAEVSRYILYIRMCTTYGLNRNNWRQKL